MTGEVALYQAPGVWISKQRAIFGSNTYAMAQVSAVAARTINPDRTGPVLLIVFGILAMVVGGGCLLGEVWGVAIGLIVIGLLMSVGGAFWYVQQKATYAIWLNTSGGQVQALWSVDWPFISGVHDALQNALIHRG